MLHTSPGKMTFTTRVIPLEGYLKNVLYIDNLQVETLFSEAV